MILIRTGPDLQHGLKTINTFFCSGEILPASDPSPVPLPKILDSPLPLSAPKVLPASPSPRLPFNYILIAKVELASEQDCKICIHDIPVQV